MKNIIENNIFAFSLIMSGYVLDDHDEEDGEGKTRKPHQFIEMFGEKSDYSQQDTVSMHFLQRYAQLDLSV